MFIRYKSEKKSGNFCGDFYEYRKKIYTQLQKSKNEYFMFLQNANSRHVYRFFCICCSVLFYFFTELDRARIK